MIIIFIIIITADRHTAELRLVPSAGLISLRRPHEYFY